MFSSDVYFGSDFPICGQEAEGLEIFFRRGSMRDLFDRVNARARPNNGPAQALFDVFLQKIEQVEERLSEDRSLLPSIYFRCDPDM